MLRTALLRNDDTVTSDMIVSKNRFLTKEGVHVSADNFVRFLIHALPAYRNPYLKKVAQDKEGTQYKSAYSNNEIRIERSQDRQAMYLKKCIKDHAGYACDSIHFNPKNDRLRAAKDHVTIVPGNKYAPYHITLQLGNSKAHKEFANIVNSVVSASTRCARDDRETCVNIYLTYEDGRFRTHTIVKKLLDMTVNKDIRKRFDDQYKLLHMLLLLSKMYTNINRDDDDVNQNVNRRNVMSISSWRH